MGLPTTIRVNAAVPFPARVVGAGTVKLTKANGIWTIALDYSAVAQISPQPSQYAASRILIWNSSTGVYTTASMIDLQAATQLGLPAAFEYIVDQGGQPLQPGLRGFLIAPFKMTVTDVAMLLDQVGSIEMDIWKCSQANFSPPSRPNSGDSITATDQPTIVTGTKYADNALTGWNTDIEIGDVLGFVILNASVATRVTLAVNGVRA